MTPDPKGPGQESVWDYPRPPRLEATAKRLWIVHGGVTIADTVRGLRTLETSHPPTYYFPPGDIATGVLRASAQRGSFCEWKGVATYWDVVVGDAFNHRTPVFSGSLQYLVFSPYWDVPPSITRKEILPKARRDHG